MSEGAGALSPATPSGTRHVVGRAFDHGQMRSVCFGFVQGSAGKAGHKSIPISTQKLLDFPLDPSLIAVLQAFVDLQEARHYADYDLARQWKRQDALNLVRETKEAFENWQKIRKSRNAAVFLTALLLQRQWAR